MKKITLLMFIFIIAFGIIGCNELRSMSKEDRKIFEIVKSIELTRANYMTGEIDREKYISDIEIYLYTLYEFPYIPEDYKVCEKSHDIIIKLSEVIDDKYFDQKLVYTKIIDDENEIIENKRYIFQKEDDAWKIMGSGRDAYFKSDLESRKSDMVINGKRAVEVHRPRYDTYDNKPVEYIYSMNEEW